MEFPKQLWVYRSSLSAFSAAIEDIKLAFDQSKASTKDGLVNFKSYLSSGSTAIIANGNRISAVCANNNSAYLSGQEPLVRLMNAATEYLRRKPLDANDESKFRTMDLSFSLSTSLIEGDVDTSQREIEYLFSSIVKAQDVIFETINNTPPVILQGTGEVALNNLESAFAKNMKDPFWLVKSSEEPFPGLITLSWPSPDHSQDPVTAAMKRCCKKWTDPEDLLDAFTEETLDVFAEKILEAVNNSFRQAKAAIAEVQVEGEEPQRQFGEVKRLVVDEVDSLQKPTSKPPRVALIGCMSHGKSSFINSLIGQELVVSEDAGSTSIPMLVQHNEDPHSLPTLHITPALFSEYVDALKDLQDDPESDIRIDSDIRNELLGKRQKENLEIFKKGWVLETIYVGEQSIIDTQHKIIDLIRLCALLTPESAAKPNGKDWPRLSVYMHEMAQLQSPYFEIVDLPGYGDLSMGKDPDFLETIYGDVFAVDVDGVILVTAVLDEPQTHADSVNVLGCGRKSLQPGVAPILLAVGTKKDLQRRHNWTMENAAYKRVFYDVKSPRFLQTSPVTYLEATSANKYLGSAPDDFMENTTLAELKKTECHTYRILERLYNFDSINTTSDEDQDMFAGLKILDIRRRVQRVINNADYGTVREKLGTYVINGVKKRRYLSHVAELRAHLEQVEEAEASALRASHGRGTVHKAIEDQRTEFSEKTIMICDEWKQARKDSMDEEAHEIMSHAVSVAYTQAFSSLRAIITRLFLEYSWDSKFEDRDKAVDFLLHVERELRRSLNTIQRSAVDSMRIRATELWSKTVDDLRDRVKNALVDNDQTALKQFKLALDDDLKELSADSIASQVQQKIEDYLRGSTPSSAEVKGKAQGLMRTMGALRKMEFFYAKKPAKSKNPKVERSSQDPAASSTADNANVHNSIAPGATPAGPVSPSTTAEQDFGDKSINEVGFLIRASPSGAMIKSSVTREIWPWIDNAPGIKVVLDSDKVVDQYKDWVLHHWKGVLEQECKITIQGAINLSLERGEKCVERFMEKKQRTLIDTQESSQRPFPVDVLEKLVLFRANAISTREVTQTLGKRLFNHLAKVDRGSRMGLNPQWASMFWDGTSGA